jgi:hypothetical protein
MQWLSHKWPLIRHGTISVEIEAALIERMTREKVLTSAHTRKNKLKEAIPITNKDHDKNPEIAASVMPTAMVVKTNGGEEYHKRSIEDDPILRQWLLKKGIDITNIDSISSHLTEDDIKVGELTEPELKQWNKEQHSKLVMKKRRIVHTNWRSKADERDKALESQLGEIKQHLVFTDSIKEQNKVHTDQIFKAFIVATGYKNKGTFRNRLHEYTDGGYLTPVDGKHKIFRAEEKFLAL